MRKRFLALTLLVAAAGIVAKAQEGADIPLDQALRKARVDGKYRMLLRQIRVESELKTFGAFNDYGLHSQSVCAGHEDLPKGYWVYVYPYWYIWRDRTDFQQPKRQWGPEQVAGEPDTPDPGDQRTAWASATQDGDDEWLLLEFAEPVRAYSVHIYETYNPGSVVRITGFTLNGSEIELWRRARPFIPSSPGFVFRPTFTRKIVTNRIKLYLDSKRTPGWNEIDAVRLRGEGGHTQWASAVLASSTYGVAEERSDPRDDRIRLLEEENRRLRQEVDALKRGASLPGEKPLPGSLGKDDG